MAATIDVTIDALNQDGDGVARLGAGALVVPYTLPGERVRVRLLPRRTSRHLDPRARTPREGRIVEVLHPSPHRVTARCRHFGPQAETGAGACGGCRWQHIAYPEQLRLKTQLVDRLVRAVVPGAPAVRPMLPSTTTAEPWGYRHRVHFVFGPGGRGTRSRGPRQLIMGHYGRGTRGIVPIGECPVHDPRGNALAFAFRDSFLRAGITAADGQEGGVLRGLAVRSGANTPDIMATVIVTGDGDARLRTATRRALPSSVPPVSLHVNLHPVFDAFVFGRHTRHLMGPPRMQDRIGDLLFAVSPTAFFQTNIGAAAILVRLVLAAIPPGSRVLDLYAGAGLFALALARTGCNVIAVEDNRAAVNDGQASARLNGIPVERCRFVAQPVERALRGLVDRPPFRKTRGSNTASPGTSARDGAKSESADAVVLDPPRDGCASSVVQHVFGRIRPAVAAYVSCDPEALARDLGRMVTHGYTIRSIQPVDMFPHTAHVETVVILTR